MQGLFYFKLESRLGLYTIGAREAEELLRVPPLPRGPEDSENLDLRHLDQIRDREGTLKLIAGHTTKGDGRLGGLNRSLVALNL